ncbi:MAG: S-layer homology domain-containing protein, partial [Clostridia bacterium]|nr:S-layer homology domain-containing protein [Clostridia bacterium]
ELTADTFKIETDYTEGSFLKQAYGDQNTAAAVIIGDNYKYGWAKEGAEDTAYLASFPFGGSVPTEPPATEAPATEAPATEAPATEAPATEAPATEAPATEAPATEAPATEAPATEAPATEAPATEAPATDAPATEAPATEAPATEAPATEAPATEAPATEAPATEAPATDAPATEAPATEAPATDAPEVTEPPAEVDVELKTTVDGIAVNASAAGATKFIITITATINDELVTETIEVEADENGAATYTFEDLVTGAEYSVSVTAANDFGSSAPVVDEATPDYVEQEENTTPSRSGSSSGASSYTVKFNANGGSAVNSIKVKKGEAVAAPVEPTKDGYTFDGWYADAALTTPYDFAAAVTKGITLYAKWAEVPATDDPATDAPATDEPAADSALFSDVAPTDWFYANVQYVVENKLFNGTSATTFDPNGAVTRAMIVTVLYRAAGEPAVEATSSFADVAADAYYYNAVLWAQANGIVKGYDDTTFGPNDSITREQLAAILWRYAGSPSATLTLDGFADAGDVSEYAVEALAWAVENGIMSGVDATTIAPKAVATRAQVAKMLNVYLESVKAAAVEETVEEVVEEAAAEEAVEEIAAE